ncbi:MAG: hypothetical protein NZ926_00500 [Candidatus Methanomethylicia archaeon]|nr:hypothetical protein [Candidatus Methanomethylicia archaeon]MCX8168915.1 hypothetical protein [Candidatus Methanomethylicia archaeon]MDW7988647.1 carbon monoxide dehydrogenase beta subunit family protein [Nitrososphaerota archaeon]
MSMEYWLKGDIPPGPIKATVISNMKQLANIIKQHKKIMLILGSELSKLEKLVNENILDKLISISLNLEADVVISSGDIARRLDDEGYKNYKIMFPLEVIQRLTLRNLEYNLAIFVGFHYYYEWLILNHLKHNAHKHLNTMSIEPYAQPNSTWTLPSLPLAVWYKNICQLEEEIKSTTIKQ